MKNTLSYVINSRNNTPISVSAYINGRSANLNSGHANFQHAIKELAKENPSITKLQQYFDLGGALSKYSNGSVTISGGVVSYNGQPVHNLISDRIVAFMQDGLPYKPLVAFLQNLMQNPSSRARNEAYRFLEALNNQANGTPCITLTSDGCFLAYKGVTSDFYSISNGSLVPVKGTAKEGKIFNGVGEYIEVDRGNVDDNCNNTCSYGLHVGSYSYASGFAGSTGKIVLVKVNPKDIVSIPTDCGAQKCRACAYEVVDVVENNNPVQSSLSDIYDDVMEDSGEVRKAKQRRDSKGRFVSN
jgi:hypothetical protein